MFKQNRIVFEDIVPADANPVVSQPMQPTDVTAAPKETTASVKEQAVNVAKEAGGQAVNVAKEVGEQTFDVAKAAGGQAVNVAKEAGAQTLNVAKEAGKQTLGAAFKAFSVLGKSAVETLTGTPKKTEGEAVNQPVSQESVQTPDTTDQTPKTGTEEAPKATV
jgi:hypothetical protein